MFWMKLFQVQMYLIAMKAIKIYKLTKWNFRIFLGKKFHLAKNT